MTAAAIAALSAMLTPPAAAQLAGPKSPSGCLRLTGTTSRITLKGRLTLRRFPGPPNFSSIAAGDAEERVFILELPRGVCIDDGGEFADPARRVVTVQISAAPGLVLVALRKSVGRDVAVSGQGFAAHTGHHHAPLVLIADEIRK